MRKLLNTLYILSEGSYLSLKNENVVVNMEDGSHRDIPLLSIESIFCFSYKGASPALIGECVERGIMISFFSPSGRFLALPTGRTNGNVLLRKKQNMISNTWEECAKIARNFIFGKVYNCKWLLERTLRDHGLRVDSEKIKSKSTYLTTIYNQLLNLTDLDVIRGMEGQAANNYFDVFDELIINQKEDFKFTSRSRRPPLDRVNALLSFGYTVLANDCASALEGVGLDSYVGFMHKDRPGRESLALDLMEEFRCLMVDRFVLTMINQRQITAKHFITKENGSVYLNEDGRKAFFGQWQAKKKEELTHPFLKEKVCWGLVPYIQALLLARYLRGDLDGYPVFLWK
ncbi:MAG: type I-C CRISPR-associated endonuclease Cas1c [Lachnospiraceae bacterium]|nr:type I-C CRISPR-associated endonuclease Cas1c [Lachnospiraceae bacterium]